MTSKLLPNGLSIRTNRCLVNAGIPIKKEVIIRALKTGKLYPYFWPPNYGIKTPRFSVSSAEVTLVKPAQTER